jgi:hypothetical protein
MRFSIFVLALWSAVLGSCQPKVPEPLDRAVFETAASEAVLRKVLKEADTVFREAKVGAIFLGARLESASPEFLARFQDVGLRWFTASDMSQVWVGPKARVIEKSSKLQPLQLQVLSVELRFDGALEIVAAWAFEERMQRKRYLARVEGDGKWLVQPLEVIEEKW